MYDVYMGHIQHHHSFIYNNNNKKQQQQHQQQQQQQQQQKQQVSALIGRKGWRLLSLTAMFHRLEDFLVKQFL